MELNLKYYKDKEKDNSLKVDYKILDYIKQYKDLDEAIIKDNSWPVFYNLSNVRKNVIAWYPFKKGASILEVGAEMGAITPILCDKCEYVTSIEKSFTKASAILERNKNRNNLEIIVGNLNDIRFNKKFDYILLCGVQEYRIDISFLEKLKKLLNREGKILIAIPNRLGVKYLCGVNEDYTNIPFYGLNKFIDDSDIRTYSKKELDTIINNVNLKANYYYMFPDYVFPQLIVTDNSLSKIKHFSYIPYYYKDMNLSISERKLFQDIVANGVVPEFANSYFVELSLKVEKKKVDFVKFNFYRKEEYKVNTYLMDNKFYKVANSKESSAQINSILHIEKLLKENGIDYLNNYVDKETIYTKYSNYNSLEEIIDNFIYKNEIDSVIKIYDNLFNYYQRILGKEIKPDKTIFEKYNIKITQGKKEKLHFYNHGFIDAIPCNILVDDDKYILYDQEWYEENIPIEYLMFRAIRNTLESKCDYKVIFKDLIKKYNIDFSLFENLDNEFLFSIYSDEYVKVISKMFMYKLINPEKVTKENEELQSNNNKLINLNNALKINNQQLTNDLINLQTNYDIIKNRLNEIEESKGFKLLNRIYKIRGKIKKNK